MSARATSAANALLAVEVEGLRLKAMKVILERMCHPSAGAADIKLYAEALSLTSWAGQPGRQERPGP